LWIVVQGQKPANPGGRFAGSRSFGAFEIIDTGTGMRVDDTKRLVLLPEVPEHRDERDMLYDIRKIPRMKCVAVIHAEILGI
jgi:hypothetical protein